MSNKGFVKNWAFIDECDKNVMSCNWCLSANGKAVNGKGGKQKFLDRYILNILGEPRKWAKHYNGDTLDCRRDNMWILDRDKDPINFRHYNLMRVYGINEEEYNKILEEQNYGCAICGRSVEEQSKKYASGKIPASMRSLAVDHCHNTGKIRGLLCYECNIGLGKFQDKSSLLERAALYLTRFEIQNR